MPPEIEPAELARIVDFSERPRTHDWSLRAALVRYAQPEPERVNDLLDVVRRTEWALGQHTAYIARDGADLWAVLDNGPGSSALDPQVVGVLRIAKELDGLGDILAAWAVARGGTRPDADVDRVTADAAQQLEVLGIPRQERPPGPRNRG